jgi:hemoglobin/transferrin/lactoferrin receptor protein
VVVLAALLVAATPATAQEQEAARAPEVVVTATRSERIALEVPYSTRRYELDAPLREGIDRTVGEVLRNEPGVLLQKTGPGQDSPYIRGLTGYHTLWLVDGIRLNNSVWRAGPNQYSATIDPFLLQRLELVRGPHSALYGSDAIGGTVNAISHDPPELADGALPIGGRVLYRWAGAEGSHTGRAEGWARAGDVRAIFGASIKDYGDIEAAKLGELEGTAYEQFDGDAKFSWRATDRLELIAAYQRSAIIDAPRTHRTTDAEPYRGTSVGSERRRDLDQDRTLGYVRGIARELGPIDRTELTFSVQRQFEERVRVRGDGRRDEQDFEVMTYGAQLQLDGESPIGFLTGGVDVYHDEVESGRKDFNADGSFRRRRIQGAVADDADYDLVGVYLQDEIELAPVLEAILGVRYTYARAEADEVEDPETGDEISLKDDWHDVSGSIRFAGHFDVPGGALHPFIGLSQGFRAPNLSDLTRLDSARSSENEVPSPDLDPERFLQLEVGTKGELGPVLLNAAWYYTWIDDMIIRRPTDDTIDDDAVVVKENAGDGWVTGVELGAEVSLGAWIPGVSVLGGFAWQEGKADTFPTSAPKKREEWLDRLAPAEGRVEVRWTSEDERFSVSADARFVRAQRKLSTRDANDTGRFPPDGSHAFTVVSVRGSARVHENVRLFGAVENVGDRAYRPHGSGQNAPGTNAILGVELRF